MCVKATFWDRRGGKELVHEDKEPMTSTNLRRTLTRFRNFKTSLDVILMKPEPNLRKLNNFLQQIEIGNFSNGRLLKIFQPTLEVKMWDEMFFSNFLLVMKCLEVPLNKWVCCWQTIWWESIDKWQVKCRTISYKNISTIFSMSILYE